MITKQKIYDFKAISDYMLLKNNNVLSSDILIKLLEDAYYTGKMHGELDRHAIELHYQAQKQEDLAFMQGLI